jgi:hypothetical protein
LEENRKIVFIAHSLGGLVTKKSCFSEAADENDIKRIDRNTIAIAFLGTPHREPAQARYGKALGTVLKASGVKVNTKVLALLERDSEVLADIVDSFSRWLRRNNNQVSVTCFYEELEMVLPGVGQVAPPNA